MNATWKKRFFLFNGTFSSVHRTKTANKAFSILLSPIFSTRDLTMACYTWIRSIKCTLDFWNASFQCKFRSRSRDSLTNVHEHGWISGSFALKFFGIHKFLQTISCFSYKTPPSFCYFWPFWLCLINLDYS